MAKGRSSRAQRRRMGEEAWKRGELLPPPALRPPSGDTTQYEVPTGKGQDRLHKAGGSVRAIEDMRGAGPVPGSPVHLVNADGSDGPRIGTVAPALQTTMMPGGDDVYNKAPGLRPPGVGHQTSRARPGSLVVPTGGYIESSPLFTRDDDPQQGRGSSPPLFEARESWRMRLYDLVAERAGITGGATMVHDLTDVRPAWQPQESKWEGLREVAPVVAPRGPSMWFEWHMGDEAVGVLVEAVDLQPKGGGGPEWVGGVLPRWFSSRPSSWRRDYPDARWVYELRLFLWFEGDGEVRLSPYAATVGVDREGVPADGFHMWQVDPRSGVPVRGMDMNAVVEEERDGLLLLLDGALFALHGLSLLGCSNITAERVEPHVPRQERRRREREGKPPYVAYSVIRVQVGGRRMSVAELGASRGGEGGPVHVIPGRVRTYSSERPLFGRWVGSWYWAPFVRGNPDRGARVHSYRLVPGDGELHRR